MCDPGWKDGVGCVTRRTSEGGSHQGKSSVNNALDLGLVLVPVAELPLNVQFVTVGEQKELNIPPPL